MNRFRRITISPRRSCDGDLRKIVDGELRSKRAHLRSLDTESTEVDEGVPPSKYEVQMGKRTGGKRGVPVGNSNRLSHGRYSARRVARRKEVQALLRGMRNLTRKIEIMGWARKALRNKYKAQTSARPWRHLLEGGLRGIDMRPGLRLADIKRAADREHSWIVHRRGLDDLERSDFPFAEQRRSALGAEHARDLAAGIAGRGVGFRRALDDGQRSARDHNRRGVSAARRILTGAAVAVHHRHRIGRDFVAHRLARTSALKRHGFLPQAIVTAHKAYHSG